MLIIFFLPDFLCYKTDVKDVIFSLYRLIKVLVCSHVLLILYPPTLALDSWHSQLCRNRLLGKQFKAIPYLKQLRLILCYLKYCMFLTVLWLSFISEIAIKSVVLSLLRQLVLILSML